MKKLQYGILIVILPLVLAFSGYFFPTKPLSIVKDIGQLPVDTNIDGQDTIVFKGNLYFFRETQQTGRELWSVDKNNNVSLALETIPGRESASIQALFESNSILYLIAQVPNEYKSLIYYLEDPQGEFVEIRPDMYININNLKEFNGKYFTLTNSDNNSNNTIIEFDGTDIRYHTITGNNWFYTIEDFTYFNNEIYYSFSDDPLRELRKISGGTETTIYTSNHRIPFLYTGANGVYFIENNYNTTPSSYDLNLFKNNEVIPLKSFSTIDFGRSQVVDGKLILIAASIESQIKQLWQFSGIEQKQITDYKEEHFLRIEDLTGINGDIYFFEDGFNGGKIKYSDGLNLYDVDLNYEYIDQHDGRRIFISNDNLFVGGWRYQDGIKHKGISILNNGIATEVMEGGSIVELELFEVGSEVYSLSSKNTSEVDLYVINSEANSTELLLSFSGQYAEYIASDGANKRIYLRYREPDAQGVSPLSVIEGNSVEKLHITDTTGGSNPKKYTVVEGKTYFIAKHDEYGETIWESDGYDAQLVEASFNETPNLIPDKLFNVNDHLIFSLKETNTGHSQFWVIRDDDLIRLSQNSFNIIESSLINSGDQIYVVAGYNGNAIDNLISVNHEKIDFIVESGFAWTDVDFIRTPHGIFFTVGYDEYTGIWRLDDLSLIEIDKNELAFSASHHRKILWDSANVYIKECIDEYDTAVYKVTDSDRLEAVDIGDLSGKRCTDIWFFQLDSENIISLSDYSSETLGIWSLKEGNIVKVDSLGIPSYTYFVARDTRLYFNARPVGSVQGHLYVYENGLAKNLNLGLVSNLHIAKESQEDGVDWLLYKEQYASNGYQLYKYDGRSLSLHNSITSDFRDIYKITKVGDFNFMQIGNSSGSNELIAWNMSGELTYLNSAQNISFSTNGSYQENLMDNGHGKWLFLQGCNYIVGCEPYSLNLNKLPTATFKTDKSHYVAGYKVLVDGSESIDPENNILEYNWTIVGYDNAQVENNGAVKAAIKLPLVEQDSDLTIELEIIDDGYDRSVATKTISVEVNHKPEIVISAPHSAVEGNVVKLDASASSDVEGEALSFQWSVVEGENIVLNNSNQAIASFIVPELEEDVVVTLKVAVSDTVGNISEAVVQVSLEKTEEATNPNPDNGGGGSANWLLLLMLTSLMIIRFGYHHR